MKRLYWFLGIVCLAGLACWAYYRWSTNERSVWAYIPENYLLAVESTELQNPPEPLRSYQIKLTDLPILEEAQDALQLLRQAVPDTSLLHSFLHNKTITYSLHAETNSVVNYLIYVPYQPGDQSFLSYLNGLNSNEVRGLKHQTAKQSITDVTISKSRKRFSFMQYDNYLILSPSSLLVENVAMKISKLLDVPDNAPPTPDEYATAKTKFWLNWANLSVLAGRMMSQQSAAGSLLALLPVNTAYKTTVNKVRKGLLVETTTATKDAHAYWQTFDSQQAAALISQRFIPNSTAAFYQFSLSDPIGWANRFLRYQKKHEPSKANLKSEWQDKYIISPDSVYYHINRELILCRMESDELNEGGNILLMKLNNARAFQNWMHYESGSIRQEEKAKKFEEIISGYTIRQILLPELPSLWFGSIFQGFPKTYYTVIDGYAVVASNMQAMRNYITDYKRGNVWMNSAQGQEVLRILQPRPFSLVFNAGKSWFSILKNLRSEWKGPITNLEEPIKRLNFLTWQVTVLPGKVDHQFVWTKGRVTADPSLLRKVFLQKLIPNPLGRPLQREPYVYRNAVTGTTDLILTTKDNYLIPVTVGATPTVKFRLSGPLVAPVQLMDYFGKGRDQLVLFTETHLYILNPTSKGYQLYASKPFSKLLDYELTLFDQTPERKKQFSALDADGHLYTITKATLSLMPSGLRSDIRHANLPISMAYTQGDSYAVLLQPNGSVALSNAKGLSLPNFPVQLNQPFDGPAFVETTDRDADFALQLVSANGEILKMSQEGKVVNRRQLIKPSKETRFRMLVEESAKDWLIIQQTNQNVTLFDKQANSLFNIFPITSESQLRYYDFGAETKIIAVTDSRGTMLYNLQGEALIQAPIPSLYKVTIEFAESYQKLFIYATSDKGVQILTSKIR
ncbi:hypothetical protein [Siphonobacter sp. SORGH_AS_0500]|uniref:hypothetical protein n=1 Tax=Siphonobacter sp. SORGH_AS_0500 TaxID=1864824 RepID=UPI000CC41571|nr:hypothetical protein [Siphonobacter sp. SORGH_AS_0500]MDR6195008.1 hypothetical protein [Siphonobacter sp. SORGH_AS_0500]PKK38450.1 hypothetical protein BWI96_01365 [Siphonobacter sp. SORGH_AS_0500]